MITPMEFYSWIIFILAAMILMITIAIKNDRNIRVKISEMKEDIWRVDHKLNHHKHGE